MADKTFEANIYTPDWKFISVLKDYISIVWTDRYYEEGDFELILPLTKENLIIYAKNNYIVCNQSDKVMIIEKIVTSVSSEGYKMKVTGRSAESLLRRRVTAREIITNRNTTNVIDVPIIDSETGETHNSHFAGSLLTAFNACFNENTVEVMTEKNDENALIGSSESRATSVIRFSGVISDPFNHIADAIGNISSYGDEYYDIIQSMCESKDIGFGVFRNFEREFDRESSEYSQINTEGLFDLVLYDGWNRTGSYLKKNGANMNAIINNKLYQIPSGIIFSVEYFNLQSSDAQYSLEDYKNYIYIKGDEIKAASNASVDIGEKTANFTEAYTDEDAKYYLTGTYLNDNFKEYGIFRRETFTDPGISRGLNTRKKYADRLRARGYKVLKDLIPKVVLSCEISNYNDYIYREDYYLGDLVRVKDSMNNFGTFRVTEEIISSDASGLKVYPTLEIFNEDKYIIDDSIDVGDENYYMVKVNWLFKDGKMPATKETAEMIYNIGSRFYNYNEITKSWETPKYIEYGNGAIKGISEEDGTIIDTIPSINILTKGKTFNADNYQKFANELLGVVTCQETDDFIVFPSDIGTVNIDPDELGEYQISREHYDLIYWESSRRFEPHDDSLGPESGIVTYPNGTETFNARWFPQSYRITFEHGKGGHFKEYLSFTGSYCRIDEYSEYASQAPTFVPGKFYKRKRSLYNNTYSYIVLQSPPYNWYDTSGGPESYKHYYMRTSPTILDVVIKDVPYNSMPYPPSVYADKGYKPNNPQWSPEIVRATQDATYTAQWKEEDTPDDEEDEDDDQGDGADEKRDSDKTWSPVKHQEGNKFVGDEEDSIDVGGLGYMVTFRGRGSRLFDDFKLIDGSMRKMEDGADQHSAFVYQRDIGDGMILQSAWQDRYSAPGISILRSSDWACMAKWVYWSNTWDWDTGVNTSGGVRCHAVNEVAFTNSPAVRKIKGFKSLNKNLVESSEEESSWPDNIYSSTNLSSKVTEKPANWDTTWRNYYKYTQIGAYYGICVGFYDDLGLAFTPIWGRLGAIDNPIVPFVSGSIPYDTRYTSGILNVALYGDTVYQSWGGNFKPYVEAYTTGGWLWKEIPDARWSAPASPGGIITDNWPEFVYTDKYDAMFETINGSRLVHCPEDWGTDSGLGKYRYRANSSAAQSGHDSKYYYSLSKNSPSAASGSQTIKSAWDFMGPHYEGQHHVEWDSAYWGSSAGVHAPWLKQSGASNSVIVTITGFTASQNVKPGTIATFKVTAGSVIIGASLSYEWQKSIDGGTTFETVYTGGSAYSFKATSDMDGIVFQCIVHASYSVLGEEITGKQIAGPMTLVVSDDGSDGKEPSKYEEETEEKPRDTQKPQDVEPDQPKSSSSSGSGLKKSTDVYGCGWFLGLPNDAYKDYGKYHFEYVGGGDPDDPPWVDHSGVIHNTPGWEVKGSDNGSISNGTKPVSKPSESGKGPVKKTQTPAELESDEAKKIAEREIRNAEKNNVTNVSSGLSYINSGKSTIDFGTGKYNYEHSTDNQVNETVAKIGGEGALSRQ